MYSIEFILNGNKTLIQCNIDEKLKDICLRYTSKIQKDINKLYFLYGGNMINIELTFNQIVNKIDKERKKIILLVNEVNQISIKNNLKKSKELICPQCKENIRIKIEDYKINLFECKNGHKINNISLSEFENTQYIDEYKIKCDNCNENKGNIYNNIFYICYSCNKKLCPLCKNNHDQSHNLINYENKNYICESHSELFSSYCKGCNKNICMFCENEHDSHGIIYYKNIIPNKDKIKNELNELRYKIDKMNDNIKEIINILNKTSEYLEILYKINNDIINNYNIKNRNYQILQNINEMSNKNIINDINDIINEKKIEKKLKNILKIYYKIIQINNNIEISEINNKITKKEIKEIDEINIIYKINNNVDKIKIFGYYFVENNKKNCKIIYEGKEYELTEEFNVRKCNKNTLDIKLKGIKNIHNMSYIFHNCKSLLSVPNISNWNTNNVTNMRSLFLGCSSLLSLPDISKWDLSNTTNISCLFNGCSSLKSLPNISNWNTINITDMGCLFDSLSLRFLPDISKWNTSKVKKMNGMFEDCSLLESLPDISKWDTSNVTNMGCMFYNCSSLKSLPDISKWNTSNVIRLNWIFNGCSSLASFPDITKWNIIILK